MTKLTAKQKRVLKALAVATNSDLDSDYDRFDGSYVVRTMMGRVAARVDIHELAGLRDRGYIRSTTSGWRITEEGRDALEA